MTLPREEWRAGHKELFAQMPEYLTAPFSPGAKDARSSYLAIQVDYALLLRGRTFWTDIQTIACCWNACALATPTL
jgi:hypothetical protein